MRREARLWLEAAREDLEDAEAMMGRGRWFRAAFFAQQAAEKALKALYIILLRREPPHIHTVTELYREAKEGGFSLPEDLEEQLPILNKYYLITRYPDAANGLPSESVDRVEAETSVELARRVLEHVERASGED